MSSARTPEAWLASPRRIAALYAAVFSLGLALALGLAWVATVRVLDAELDELLLVAQDELVDAHADGGEANLVRELERGRRERARAGLIAQYVRADGTGTTGDLREWPVVDARRARELVVTAAQSRLLDGHRFRTLDHRFDDGARLLLGADLDARAQFARRLAFALGWSALAASVLAVLLAAAYSRRIRLRLDATAAACEDIVGGALDRRLPVGAMHTEFDQLCAAVNRVFDRLERQTQTVRLTLDSAAHDLRGPLFRARMRLEGLLESRDGAGGAPGDSPAAAAAEAALAELDRVQSTLGTLLQLAKLDARAGEGALEQVVDAAGIVRELADLYAADAEARGIRLRTAIDDGCRVRAHPQLLAQAIANLIENALKYLSRGGHVEVLVHAADERALIEVADDGPGIPAHECARALRRFERLESAREIAGSGLGLALVAAVAELHGGSVELLPNRPGLRARMLLPLASGATAAPRPDLHAEGAPVTTVTI
jgi:signal transduction histidine kinase